MKRCTVILIMVLAITLVPATASYASAWTKIDDYGDKAAAKLGQGLRNAALGWTKILTKSHTALQKEESFLRGLIEGIAEAAGRSVGGVLQAATFPVTALDVPIPEDGENLWPYS